jgi:hypothetical protein
MFQLSGFQFFENGVEALEIALPKALVLLQPHIKRAKRRWPQLINPPLSVHANFHQSGFAENAEMFRDLRLAEAQALDQITDGLRPGAQQFDDFEAVGLGERSQSGHHRGFEYAAIRIFLSRHILNKEYTNEGC